MELIFLGTSSGTPTKERNVSAVAIKKKNTKHWYLIDSGEGTQHQILKTKLSLLHLEAIFITHVHGDHCYGLPGLLASATMQGRKKPLSIIAPEGIKKFIDSVIDTTELRLSYEINHIKLEDIKETYHIGSFAFNIIKLSHRCPSYAFHFIENNLKPVLNTEKLVLEGIKPGSVWGQLQQGNNVILEDGKTLLSDDYLDHPLPPRSIVICGDNDSPKLLNGIKPKPEVIVHESTYTENILKKVGTKPQHSCAKQIAEFAQQNQIKNLVLTHFSPRYVYANGKSESITDIQDEAEKFYSGKLFLAKDLDIYNLDKQGILRRIEGAHPV